MKNKITGRTFTDVGWIGMSALLLRFRAYREMTDTLTLCDHDMNHCHSQLWMYLIQIEWDFFAPRESNWRQNWFVDSLELWDNMDRLRGYDLMEYRPAKLSCIWLVGPIRSGTNSPGIRYTTATSSISTISILSLGSWLGYKLRLGQQR